MEKYGATPEQAAGGSPAGRLAVSATGRPATSS